MVERIIDLDEEFLSLFKKEEMFAFFDFGLDLPGDRTASGLCKISRPKAADSDSYYISLLFMIDAAEDAVCQAIHEHIDRINWRELEASVPEIVTVLSLPHTSPRSGIYFREIDIYLSGDKLTKSFFAQFHPRLAEVAAFQAASPIFWDDMPRDAKPVGKSAPPEAKGVAWYIERVKGLFG